MADELKDKLINQLAELKQRKTKVEADIEAIRRALFLPDIRTVQSILWRAESKIRAKAKTISKTKGRNMARSINEMKPGDYVKTDSGLKQIKSIWGLDHQGRPAPPSKGGFGVVATDGTRVSMWEAKSYHKKEDVEAK